MNVSKMHKCFVCALSKTVSSKDINLARHEVALSKNSHAIASMGLHETHNQIHGILL